MSGAIAVPFRAPVIAVSIAAMLTLAAACGGGAVDDATGGPVAMRRLTESQYRAAIADVFGPEIDVVGRFEPDNRREGLVAVGAAWVSVTPSGFEQYENTALAIASQVVALDARDRFLPCAPRDPSTADPDCAEAILRAIAPRLLRRAPVESDLAARLDVANRAATEHADFYVGVEVLVSGLLVSPEFLFRVELAEPDPGRPDRLRLTDETVASRMSYLLWNAGPDEALLEAVASGAMSSADGLSAELDRMLASPRLEAGVRAFFEDLFRFDAFSSLGKDPIRYPKFSSEVAADAREQTLRVVVDHLVDRRADYRDLFTTPRSFLTRRLGAVYAVPVAPESGWAATTFDVGDPRRGLLAHASFNMLNAHPGRSSATLRGVFLREALLCQTVPPAPADVDFGLFNEDDNPAYKTARDRLGVHSSNATCRNCHALSDPIGLGLEVFDGIGGVRASENGAPIDTSGELDGRPFADTLELGEAFSESPLVGACLVENLYRYAVGREIVNAERRQMRRLEREFEDADHRLHALLRAIVLSPGFRTAAPTPRDDRAPASVASSNRAGREAV